MTFDPFFDFETRGYLRNQFGEKDLDIVRRLEHSSFVQGVEAAFAHLASRKQLTYADVLATHKALFEDVYPWAGEDRARTSPTLAVSRGPVLFAHPHDASRAVEYALQLGQSADTMRERPGEVMGFLAYGHPFLDGNGRTIMVVHAELAQRADFSVDWSATDKRAYLAALTQEIQHPGQGRLDDYLRPFIGAPVGRDALSHRLRQVHGPDDVRAMSHDESEVSGNFSDPALQARYQHQEDERRRSYESRDPVGDYLQRMAGTAEPEAGEQRVPHQPDKPHGRGR